MPPANEVKNQGKTLRARLLLYGAPKTKKSWWALNAGIVGFNTIYLDGENSRHIIKNVSDAALKRTVVVDLKDEQGRQCYCTFMADFLKGYEFLWDEQDKRRLDIGQQLNPEHSHLYINAKKLTDNDHVIWDSYTAFVESTRAQDAASLDVDLSDGANAIGARDSGAMRSVFFADGVGLSWALKQFVSLPCHVTMIGHKSIYELYDPKDKQRKNGPISVRTQIQSSSGPHGMSIGGQFSDILDFSMLGTAFKIDTSASQTKLGGCRTIEPGLWDWDKLQFTDYAKMANIPLPASDVPRSEAVVYYPPGETPEFWSKPKGNSVLKNSGDAAKVSVGTAVTAEIKTGSLPNLTKPTFSFAKKP